MAKYFNNTHVFLYTIFCCTIILIGSCKKKETPQYFNIDKSFKDWSLFQKGSYWVFLNEISLQMDSSYVTTDPRIGYLPPDPDVINHYEQIYYELTNSFIKYVEINKNSSESDMSFSTDYADNTVFAALFSGYTDGSWFGSAYSCSFVEKIDTMIVNTNKFRDVIHTRVIDSYYNNLQFDYYFVKNVGWVKYSIKTSTMDSTWSLLRYHVVQ